MNLTELHTLKSEEQVVSTLPRAGPLCPGRHGSWDPLLAQEVAVKYFIISAKGFETSASIVK